MTTTIILSIVIALLILVIFHLMNKSQQEIEALDEKITQLKQSNLSLETNQLKFQLQPHTLNNILSNLRVFSSKLNRGMESLSETLEYIFYKNDDTLVSIEDEIGFVKSYLELNDLFLHEIDAIQLFEDKVDSKSEFYSKVCIPHLISAYFIENAFKHGDTKHPEFLKINIELQENVFTLNVINKIKKKNINTKSGIGLKNMQRRLNILMEGKYEVKNSCNEEEYYSTLILKL
jgi:LytS/YehU family sensor histidine kinase